VFLASLWLKYGKVLSKRDHDGKCPVHPNAARTKPAEGLQIDLHLLAKVVEARPADKAVIDEAFSISQQMVKSAPKNVPNAVKLRLYGLYKQSTAGDVSVEEPSKLSIVEHSKWTSWNEQRGKSQMAAKREYFQTAYSDIVVAFNLKAVAFDEAVSSRPAPSIDFNVQSKLQEVQFDEAVHGDPMELFNKFDLTQSEVDVGAIEGFIRTNQCDLDKQNENGTTFLNFAVDNGHLDLVRILVEDFGADVNIADNCGFTPLHSAAMSGNAEMVSFLIDCGADKGAKSTDSDEETPFDLAEDADIQKLLSIRD